MNATQTSTTFAADADMIEASASRSTPRATRTRTPRVSRSLHPSEREVTNSGRVVGYEYTVTRRDSTPTSCRGRRGRRPARRGTWE